MPPTRRKAYDAKRVDNIKKKKDVVHLSEVDTQYFTDLLATCQDNNLLAFETLLLAKVNLFLTESKAELLDLSDDHVPESEELQQGNESMDIQHGAGEIKDDGVADDSTDLYDPRNPPTQPRIIIEMLTSDAINNGLDNDSDSDLDVIDNDDIESIIGRYEEPFLPVDDTSVEMSIPAVDDEDREPDNQRSSLHSASIEADGDGEDMSLDHQIELDTPSHVVNIEALLQAFHHLATSYPGGWKITPGVTSESLIATFPEVLKDSLSADEKNRLCIMAHRATNEQGMYVGYDAESIGIHCAESLNKVDMYGKNSFIHFMNSRLSKTFKI